MAIFTINTKKQETKKWETEINVTTTNIKKVKVFVNWRLSIYKKNGQKGFNLQESFINNFKLFIKDIFNNFNKD